VVTKWRDALALLTEMGWEMSELEGACEALNEVCGEDSHTSGPSELTARQVEDLMGDELTVEEGQAFQLIAHVFGREDDDSRELRQALWEIDDDY